MDPGRVERDLVGRRSLQRQYQQGGYLNIRMHPVQPSAAALRIAMLEPALIHAGFEALPGVWFPDPTPSRWRARILGDTHPARC